MSYNFNFSIELINHLTRETNKIYSFKWFTNIRKKTNHQNNFKSHFFHLRLHVLICVYLILSSSFVARQLQCAARWRRCCLLLNQTTYQQFPDLLFSPSGIIFLHHQQIMNDSNFRLYVEANREKSSAS